VTSPEPSTPETSAIERRFPLLRGGHIPWQVAECAYREYAKRYGRSQSLERLAERGGFDQAELDELHPGWRLEVELLPRLRSELSALRQELEEARAERDGLRRAARLVAECKRHGCRFCKPALRRALGEERHADPS